MTDTASPSIRTRLRDKLPEILLEAGSVLFALLLAFGVDEWREKRDHAELAARARAAVLAELQENRRELQHNQDGNDKALAAIPEQLARLAEIQRTKAHGSIDFQMGVAQLSGAAWQTAQATQATQFMEYAWVVRIARVHELQRLYTAAQQDLILRIAAIDQAPEASLRDVQGRLRVLQGLGADLLKTYGDVLGASATETAGNR